MRMRRRSVLVAVALAVGLIVGASHEAVAGLIGRDRWNWAEFALYFGMWALLTPFLAWWQRWLRARPSLREHPDVRNRRWREENVTPVLHSGVLPVGIDRNAWRRPVRDENQEQEVRLWTWLGLNLVVAALTGVAAVVANDNAWTVWAVAVVVAAQGAVGARLMEPRLRTARRLLAELSDRRVEP